MGCVRGIICAVIAISFSSACQSVPNASALLSSWIGAPQAELENTWGQPIGKTITKKGDQMLLFEVPRADAPTPSNVASGLAKARVSPTLCRALFTVSPLGMVTSVKGLGDGCADR
jgi:hypothetical protein